MQKEFEKIVEKIKTEMVATECNYRTSISIDRDEFCYSCKMHIYKKMLNFVNQVAEEYSHRNSDLVIKSSHRNEEVCEWEFYYVNAGFPFYKTCTETIPYIPREDKKYCQYCGKKIKVVE